ncbi:MAG: flippase-like domain-containing protein, partial [Actinobacteria bacterium]|nr:flippase-like domain-containing protein [Actinomycetota bacterium]
NVVAAGFGAFFSASAAGGFEVDYWALRHAGLTRREALKRVLGLGTLEYAILAPAAMFSAIAILVDASDHVRASMSWPWLAVFPGAALAIWLAQPDRAARWGRIDGRDGRLRRAFGHAVAGLSVVRSLFAQPRTHGLGLAGASLYWFGEMLCLWAALMAFGAPVRVPVLIVGFATGYVLTRRGLPFGGAGVAEVALTFALVWLHVPFAPALLAVFSYRFFNFWLALVPAFAARGTMARIRAEVEPEIRKAA